MWSEYDVHHGTGINYWLRNYSFIQHIIPEQMCDDVNQKKKDVFAWSHPSNRYIAWSNCRARSEHLWKTSTMVTIEPMYTKIKDYCFYVAHESIKKTISVPYVSWLHTHDDVVFKNIWAWPKKYLVSIYATVHRQASRNTNRLRKYLYSHCTPKWNCYALPKNTSLKTIISTYLSSTFCLQPQGDTPTRAGIFDSLSACCIPVFISGCDDLSVMMDTIYYPFLSREYRVNGVGNWSISIHIRDIGNLSHYLKSFSEGKIHELRHNIRNQLENFTYTHSGNVVINSESDLESL